MMSSATINEDDRRLVRCHIPDEAVPAILRDGTQVDAGLPSGSQLVRMYDNIPLDAQTCIFRHPTFDVVDEGSKIPARNVYWNPPRRGLDHGGRKRSDGVVELAMTHEVFSALFWEGTTIHHEFPDDTRFGRMYEDEARRIVAFQFLSEAFETPDEGDMIPRSRARELWGMTFPDGDENDILLSSYTGDSG